MKLSINKNLIIIIMASIILAPFFILFLKSFNLNPSDQESWNFTKDTLAPITWASLKLAISTVILTTMLGLFTSFSTHLIKFPLRKYFQILHLLPLAIPLYVLAFIYLGLFEYSGPIHTFLRGINIDIYNNIPLKQWPGVSLVISLGLYSYIYLICSNSLKNFEGNLLKVSLSLGRNKFQTLLKVLLPIIKPSVLAGMVIVAMETLSDFGAVSAFNYDTFTTSIYTAWSSLFSFPVAARLSLFLLSSTAVLMYFESRFEAKNNQSKSPLGSEYFFFTPNLLVQYIVLLFNIIVLLFSLAVPLITLLIWAIENIQLLDQQYLSLTLNSVLLSVVMACILLCIGFFYSYFSRNKESKKEELLIKLSLFGYAIPGNVIAVGVLIFSSLILKSFDIPMSFSTSILAVIIGLSIRFLAVSYRNINSPFQLVSKNLDKVASSLGKRPWQIVKKVHLPLLKPTLATTFILIFIETIKELPLTLMLRPTGFDTLAIKTYELTSEGEWKKASVSAIFLTLLAIASSLVIHKNLLRNKHD